MTQPRRKTRLDPTWRKRLEWIALLPTGPWGGDVHAARWASRHPWRRSHLDKRGPRKGIRP